MSAFLRVAALFAAALLSACASEFVRPVPQGSVGGGERVEIVAAFPDQAHFTRMAVMRWSDSEFFAPASNWGIPQVATKAVAETLQARHPGMTIVTVPEQFTSDEFWTFLDAFPSAFDEPYGALPPGKGGRIGDYVRQSTADLVVVVGGVGDRLPDSNETVRGVPARSFGMFSTVWAQDDQPRISAFAAVRVLAVVKPELARIGVADATECYDPQCPGEKTNRWKDDGRRYGSWDAVKAIRTDPAMEAMVRNDVRGAVDAAVRRAVTNMKF